MGDKGKKDKEKTRKQKLLKQGEAAKKIQDKLSIRLPSQKIG